MYSLKDIRVLVMKVKANQIWYSYKLNYLILTGDKIFDWFPCLSMENLGLYEEEYINKEYIFIGYL